jgi:hypothetical protein
MSHENSNVQLKVPQFEWNLNDCSLTMCVFSSRWNRFCSWAIRSHGPVKPATSRIVTRRMTKVEVEAVIVTLITAAVVLTITPNGAIVPVRAVDGLSNSHNAVATRTTLMMWTSPVWTINWAISRGIMAVAGVAVVTGVSHRPSSSSNNNNNNRRSHSIAPTPWRIDEPPGTLQARGTENESETETEIESGLETTGTVKGTETGIETGT